jgi:hypothetical protein
MRGKTFRGAWWLVAWLALAPAGLQAQQYAPADPQVWLPYGSTRPEDGGLFTSATFGMYRQTNPLRTQLVAVRGLFAYDTGGRSVVQNVPLFIQAVLDPATGTFFIPTGLPNGRLPTDLPDLSNDTGNLPPNVPAGVVIIGGIQSFVSPTQNILQGAFILRPTNVTIAGLFDNPGFVGSAEAALDVGQLHQRNSYQPSVELGLGWKFRDGSSVQLNWLYISQAQYRAGATLARPVGPGIDPANSIGLRLENTFLFAPVFNFPPEYAGADFKVNVLPGAQDVNGNQINVNAQTAFGIWNAASIMTLEFRQRFQQWEIAYREPIFETETYRVSGIVGPRFSWIWEKFKWRTTSIGQNTNNTADTSDDTVSEGPQFVAIYSNVTSNRMYGVHASCEQEWYLGRGFAMHLRTGGALFVDSVKERAKYETGAKYLGLPENKTAKREWSFVPELQASAGMMWYPTEFVQIYAGYDFMAFFNTIASPRPIDFDYSSVNPRWTHVNRFFDGWKAGIAFTW